ncbi:MAG: AEC family transporter [Bacteroidota bacterium]
MDQVFGVVLPLFALILCGYLARKKNLLNETSTAGLVNVVYYFLLPAFLFMKTLGSTLQHGVDWRLCGSYYGAAALIFGIAVLTGRWLYRHQGTALLIRGLAATFSNTGYMGVPLLILAFGDAAIAPAVTIVVFDSILVLTGGSILMEIARGQGVHWTHALGSALRGIPTNPLIMSVPVALAFLLLGIALPPPVKVFADLLSSAAIAAALIALGATLAVPAAGVRRSDVWEVIVLKLLAHPVAVYVLARYVFGLGELDLKVAVIMASLPVAVNIYILASRYGAYARESSRIMFLSTAASVFVTSAALLILA